MKERSLTGAYVLSGIAIVVMAVVSAAGVFASGLYRDNELVRAILPAQDAVTLAVALPVFVLGIALELRGSMRGRVIWIAMLAYTLYGYLFYLFGAAFNVTFLGYVALVALSLYALLFSVPRIDVEAIGAGFTGGAARWAAIAYLALTATGLGLLWTGMSLGFVFTRQVPSPVLAFGHPTSVVFALDLTLIVPACVLGIVWLAQRKAWGWFLATVLSVKGTVYTLGLAVATVWTQRAGLSDGSELPIWTALTLVGAVSALLLLRALQGRTDAHPSVPAELVSGVRASGA